MKCVIFRMLIVVVLGTTTISFASAQGIKFVESSFKEALAQAKQENKLLFMDCYTSWCGPCRLLANRVFPNDSIGQFFNTHFISLKMDMEKGEGPALARQYGVKAYPTLLFIDPSSQAVVSQVVGFRTVKALLEDAQKAANPNRNLQGLAAQFNENPSNPAYASAYLEGLWAASLTQERDEMLKSYLTRLTPEEICTAENWKILSAHTENPYSFAFDCLHKHRDSFRDVVGKEAVDAKLDHLYRYATMKFIFRKRMPENEFPQNDFNKLLYLLKQEKGSKFAYYLTQLEMIDNVQKGDYRGMLDVLDRADKKQILTPQTRFYFIWLNLTYLKECKDKKALKRGLKWAEKLEADSQDPYVSEALNNIKKTLQGNMTPD